MEYIGVNSQTCPALGNCDMEALCELLSFMPSIAIQIIVAISVPNSPISWIYIQDIHLGKATKSITFIVYNTF